MLKLGYLFYFVFVVVVLVLISQEIVQSRGGLCKGCEESFVPGTVKTARIWIRKDASSTGKTDFLFSMHDHLLTHLTEKLLGPPRDLQSLPSLPWMMKYFFHSL